MIWHDVMTRLKDAGLNPIEETYMENYGKILTAQRPEFRDRIFRCAYGVVNCIGVDLELFLFPDEMQSSDFMDVIGSDPWWLTRGNVVLHFPECDPAIVASIVSAIA